MTNETHYMLLAAAAVRGHSLRCPEHKLPADLTEKPLEALQDEEIAAILEQGSAWGVKLYRFKRGHEELPRVKAVMGFLRSVYPESLLDVGSGRGVFLFPFMDTFPWCRVTSLDILPYRVDFLENLRRGGIGNLTALEGDICTQPFPDNSFDVVTMLEVLEHIPEVEKAVFSAVRMAKKYVQVSVPSKPDDNPEHIHLLTKDILTELFAKAGCTKLHFGGVNGHLLMTATIDKE